MKIFEKLQKITNDDVKNGTRNLLVSNQKVSVDKKGGICSVSMQVDEETLLKLSANDDIRLMLCVVDGKTFDKTK